jgi:hypothetical protein
MNHKVKAGLYLGISLGLLISVYVAHSGTLSVIGRVAIALGTAIYGMLEFKSR